MCAGYQRLQDGVRSLAMINRDIVLELVTSSESGAKSFWVALGCLIADFNPSHIDSMLATAAVFLPPQQLLMKLCKGRHIPADGAREAYLSSKCWQNEILCAFITIPKIDGMLSCLPGLYDCVHWQIPIQMRRNGMCNYSPCILMSAYLRLLDIKLR